MATSSNKTIQNYMNQVDDLDENDPKFEAKMNAIAEAVARAEGKLVNGNKQNIKVDENAITDPAEGFQCEGCT